MAWLTKAAWAAVRPMSTSPKVVSRVTRPSLPPLDLRQARPMPDRTRRFRPNVGLTIDALVDRWKPPCSSCRGRERWPCTGAACGPHGRRATTGCAANSASTLAASLSTAATSASRYRSDYRCAEPG